MRRLPFLCIAFSLLSANSVAQMVWDRALTLTGTHPSYAVVAPNAMLNPRASMTMECWINPTNALSPTDQTLLSKTTTSNGYQLFLRNGIVCAGFNGLIRCRSTVPVPSGEWTHVAATLDSSTGIVAVYLNGYLDSSVTGYSVAITPCPDSLFIGRAGYTTQGLFAGSVDNIRIWDHALPSDQIRATYRSIIKTGTGVYHGLLLSMPMQMEYGYSGTIADYSGNGIVCSARGSYTWLDMRNAPSVTTSPNEAAHLDGSGYLSAPSSTANNISGSFTLEAWVWPVDLQSSIILQKREGSNATGYTLWLYYGKPSVRTNGSTRLYSSTVIPLTEWTHLAATYDTATGLICLYINGELDSSVVATGAKPAPSSDSLFIGNGFNGAFNGYLDEVRIANYAKSADLIKQFAFCSIDNNNEPTSGNTNIVYSFDGTLMDVADLSTRLAFQGSAQFSHPGGRSNVPVSPLLREDNINYPEGFWMKPSTRKIPASGTVGMMTDDTLFVSQSVTITSLRLAVLINHTAEADCRITLVGPGGDSVDVDVYESLIGNADNIITIFDDAAPSTFATGPYLSWTPLIRPSASLASAFNGKKSDGPWRLRINDYAGGDSGRVYAWGLQFNNSSLVSVSDKPTVAEDFRLEQNYPNPFNPTTVIRGQWTVTSDVRLDVYDVLGRRVAMLANGRYPAGTYSFTFNARGCASGVYFYKLTAGTYSATNKMMLVK